MNRKLIFRWLKVIILLYSLVGIAFYYLQDRILFHPAPLPSDYSYTFNMPYKEINIPYTAQSNINIIQFPLTAGIGKGVVLYFHGNEKNIGRYAQYAPYFTKQGYEVWMIDYPGFGKSTGNFEEKILYDWALALYKFARTRFSPDSIIIYGKSFGTGIAAQLASIRDCRYLLLETPYHDFQSIVGDWLPMYPLTRMMRFKIPTWQYLQKVDAPVTIFHGTNDGIIGYGNAKRLQKFLQPNSEFITIEGGSHNDLYTFPLFIRKLDSILMK